MQVTFDPVKDLANIRKHVIYLRRASDFDWNTAHFEVDGSQDYGEIRY